MNPSGPALPSVRRPSVDGLPYHLYDLGFKRENILGSGSFGKVFKIFDPTNFEPCALKITKIDKRRSKSYRDQLVKEVQMQIELVHRNIVRIHGAFPEQIDDPKTYEFLTSLKSTQSLPSSQMESEVESDASSFRPVDGYGFDSLEINEHVLCIKMELCERSLFDEIKSREEHAKNVQKTEEFLFGIGEVENIFGQLLAALDYIRTTQIQGKVILHNDIKPNNILFKNDIVKLADFGLGSFSSEETPTTSSNRNTNPAYVEMKRAENRIHNYQSPELIDKGPLTHKSDVFSVGAVIFRLFVRHSSDVLKLFNQKNAQKMFTDLRIKFEDHWDLINVIEKMVSMDPVARPDTSSPELMKFISHPAPLFERSLSRPFEIVPREGWGAREPKVPLDVMELPVSNVIITQSVMGEGYSTSDESSIYMVKDIQNRHMDINGWDDIAYQFVVGGNGVVYEGRKWNQVGAHAFGYNRVSVGICLIGEFTVHLPPFEQMETTKKLIRYGVRKGYITKDYKLYGLRDVRPMFQSPGECFYNELRTWDNKASPPASPQ